MSVKTMNTFKSTLIILTLFGFSFAIPELSRAFPSSLAEVDQSRSVCTSLAAGSSCQYSYCPPMAPCPSGKMCAQVMPACINFSGTCHQSYCQTKNSYDLNGDNLLDGIDYTLLIAGYGTTYSQVQYLGLVANFSYK